MASVFGMNGLMRMVNGTCLWSSMEIMACRNGETIDQISGLINQIKTNPDQGRLIVTGSFRC